MAMTVKINGRNGKKIHVEIPPGWKAVTSGVVYPQDQYYNLVLDKLRPVENEDIQKEVKEFSLIIREEFKRKK